jgi:hypothetical protein
MPCEVTARMTLFICRQLSIVYNGFCGRIIAPPYTNQD